MRYKKILHKIKTKFNSARGTLFNKLKKGFLLGQYDPENQPRHFAPKIKGRPDIDTENDPTWWMKLKQE